MAVTQAFTSLYHLKLLSFILVAKNKGHDISGGLATGYQITNNKNIGPTARALRRLKAVGETEYRAARVTSALNESRKIFGQIVNFYGRQYVQETFSRGRTEDLVASNF